MVGGAWCGREAAWGACHLWVALQLGSLYCQAAKPAFRRVYDSCFNPFHSQLANGLLLALAAPLPRVQVCVRGNMAWATSTCRYPVEAVPWRRGDRSRVLAQPAPPAPCPWSCPLPPALTTRPQACHSSQNTSPNLASPLPTPCHCPLFSPDPLPRPSPPYHFPYPRLLLHRAPGAAAAAPPPPPSSSQPPVCCGCRTRRRPGGTPHCWPPAASTHWRPGGEGEGEWHAHWVGGAEEDGGGCVLSAWA